MELCKGKTNCSFVSQKKKKKKKTCHNYFPTVIATEATLILGAMQSHNPNRKEFQTLFSS
jgi:hypothetical protein